MSLLINDKDLKIHRRGFGLQKAIGEALTNDYRSGLVDWLRHNDYTLRLPGLTLELAREFGFCYGVDRAIDYAYETRAAFPDRRIFLTTEIIHNPKVNKRLLEMGVGFLHGQYASGLTLQDIRPEDVVILPAFGVSTDELSGLRDRGCVLVDTTCGSVMNVWKKVAKYEANGLTAIIHGKYDHEETIATASYASSRGGHYVVVRDLAQAEEVCDYIRGKGNRDSFLNTYAKATSRGFDPDLHLESAGVANQTTMLSSESLEIARRVGQAYIDRYGPNEGARRFESFDTICSATQERQDAIVALVGSGTAPDLVMVVGGFNSSNTGHLLEISELYTRAFHIEDASCIPDATRLRHKRFGQAPEWEERPWLPEGETLRIGFTSGASTPNSVLGEVMLRLMELRQVPEEALACALAEGSPVPDEGQRARK